jgi:hypothetical protein
MRHVPVPAFALVLCALTFRVSPIEPVAVIGLAGMLLVIVGMVMPWRWPIITAACLFTTNHALALWAMDAPVSIFGASCFGLAQLGLLQAADLRRCTRAATVGSGVVRVQIARGIAFAALTLASTMLGTAIAGPLSAALPVTVAPVLAAAGALGVVIALAMAAMSAGRRRSG